MPFYLFIWLDETIEHLAEHDVTTEDFEAIVSNPVREATSRSTGRPMAYGWTEDGRYVLCVYELEDDGITVVPVTAYEVEE